MIIIFSYKIKTTRATDGSLHLDSKHILTTLNWASNRISKLNDLVTPDMKFLWVKPIKKESTIDLKYLEVVDILSKKLESLENDKFSKESLKLYLKEFAVNNNISFSDLMKTLRSLLSGLKVSITVTN